MINMFKFNTIIFLIISLSFRIYGQTNDYIIDTDGIGDIKLCDKITDITSKYSNNQPLEFEGDEGVTWKGFKLILPDNEWIIIESSWTDPNRIWRISTNSKRYKTLNGYSVGDPISKMKNSDDEISFYESEMGFQLIADILSFGFSIESRYTDDFYKKVNACKGCTDYVKYLSDKATIQEIIISGGCN